MSIRDQLYDQRTWGNEAKARIAELKAETPVRVINHSTRPFPCPDCETSVPGGSEHTFPECVAALKADAAYAKDDATSRLDVAEAEADRLRALLQRAKSEMIQARVVLADFKSRHTAAGCGMDAMTGSLHVMTTGVGLKP